MRLLLSTFILVAMVESLAVAQAPKRDWQVVELVGEATDHWYNRNWRAYYWREDFSFVLKDAEGKSRRVISREPTPAYIYRMGTTFPKLEADWKKNPKVKIVGVKAVDRIPAEFYHFKLDDPELVTALIVWVETKPNMWSEYYVNNWFHQWGEKADKAVFAHYADKEVPYDIYGFARGQVAPFSKKSQEVLDKYPDQSPMFHGKVRSTKTHAFGYEIELIDLIGKNVKSGGHTILFGDAKTIPLLDSRKPEKGP